LWEFWRGPKESEGEPQELRTCTIITCPANECVAPVHERMPVLLSGAALWDWLEGEDPQALQALLRPYPAELMTSYSVSTDVNKPDMDLPELVRPLAA
jgi:putative SOS response-associated peptidase YedK